MFLVDDGTGTITVTMSDAIHVSPQRGEYVLLVGAVEVLTTNSGPEGHMKGTCGRYRLLCDVIKDVGSGTPNRETLWGLEVVDFWKGRELTSF
ncbi:unnamed protein product [Ascophyllum nodosum]